MFLVFSNFDFQFFTMTSRGGQYFYRFSSACRLIEYNSSIEINDTDWMGLFLLQQYILPPYTQKTVSLIYAQRKNIFELKKVFLIQKIFFNVNKSISLDKRKFFWINKTFFNSKKFFLWPYIKEMFLWFKETVFSVYQIGPINIMKKLK